MSTIRVSALQLQAHDRQDFRAQRSHILSAIEAAARSSDVLAAPEGTFPAYVLGYEPVDAEDAARDLRAVAEIARRTGCTIVAGFAIPHARGIANAAVAIDSDGSVAGRADKIFLWHFDRRWFTAGTQVQPVQTSQGVLGLLVCADGRIPSIARTLAERGAELFVMPTAWVTSGRNPGNLENIQADLLARVRAFENGIPFVAANKCGVERGMVAYCGKSQIVDGAGTVCAMAPEREPAVVRANVERGSFKPQPPAAPMPPAAEKPSPARVLIGSGAAPPDVQERLDLLDADVYLGAGVASPDGTLQRLAAIPIDGAAMLNPATAVLARRAGYAMLVWNVVAPDAWTVAIARARALEVRMYVVVFDRAADRAFAVDPDGTVIGGTFGAYRFASFAFEPSRVAATAVAPGTDVAEGLARVAAMVSPS